MVIQGHENATTRKLGYGFLFAFCSNYGHIFSRFDAIHEHDRHPVIHRTTARRKSRTMQLRYAAVARQKTAEAVTHVAALLRWRH